MPGKKLWRCINSACKNPGKKPYEKEHKTQQKCRYCGTNMTDVATIKQEKGPDIDERFDSCVEALLKEKELEEQNRNHINKVVAALRNWRRENEGDFFHDDFLKEMKKPSERTKLISGKRTTAFGKSCVDQAFASLALAAVYPAGEKFTFELPHYMSDRGFTYWTTGKIFSWGTKDIPDKVDKKSLYFILGCNPPNDITHAMIITTGPDGVPRYTEVQNNGIKNYAKFIGWKSDKEHDIHPAESKLFPKF